MKDDIFGLCWKLEISYTRVIEGFWFLFRGFFLKIRCIFAWWNIWVPSKRTSKEPAVLFLVLWLFWVFENHGYILKPVIFLRTTPNTGSHLVYFRQMVFLQRPNKDIKFHNSYFFGIKTAFCYMKGSSKHQFTKYSKNHMQIIIIY